MRNRRLMVDSGLVVTLVICLALLMAESLLHEHPFEDIVHAAEMVAFLIIAPFIVTYVTAFVITNIAVREKIQSLIDEIERIVRTKISDTIGATLCTHMKAIDNLTAKIDRAALNFEICNRNSPLVDLLLTKDMICDIEKNINDMGKIYIVARDLKFDLEAEVYPIVAGNLRRNVQYHYLLKEGAIHSNDIDTFKRGLASLIDGLNSKERTSTSCRSGADVVDLNTHFAHVPHLKFNFLTDIVVYNPGKIDGTCKGYVSLPAKDLPWKICAILITDPNSLRDLVDSILAMKDVDQKPCIPK